MLNDDTVQKIDSEQDKLTEIRKLQLLQIKLIRLFVDICEKENLSYYMSGGTMLGAVRHNGYIPWDDDADFMMPREDYEKFIKVAPKYFNEDYSIDNFIYNKNFLYYFTRVVSLSDCVKITSARKDRTENIWIDILPLDGMPKGKFLFNIHKFRLLALRALYHYSLFDDLVNTDKPNRPWYEKILIFIGIHFPIQKMFSHSKRWLALDKGLKKYPCEDSDIWVNFMGGYKLKEMFPKSVFGDGNDLYDFEGMKLVGVKDYDTYLTGLYGDYMTPPPVEERTGHIS